MLRNELIETQKEMLDTMGEIGESRSQETGNYVFLFGETVEI